MVEAIAYTARRVTIRDTGTLIKTVTVGQLSADLWVVADVATPFVLFLPCADEHGRGDGWMDFKEIKHCIRSANPWLDLKWTVANGTLLAFFTFLRGVSHIRDLPSDINVESIRWKMIQNERDGVLHPDDEDTESEKE